MSVIDTINFEFDFYDNLSKKAPKNKEKSKFSNFPHKPKYKNEWKHLRKEELKNRWNDE
jgi:hypothetical protein